MPSKRYSVFISHNTKDKPQVQKIISELFPYFYVWFDKADMLVGEDWTRQVTQGLRDSEVCAVFVGENGFGPSQLREVEIAKAINIRLFCVFLPGASPEKIYQDLQLLNTTIYANYMQGGNRTAFDSLVAGILGKPVGWDFLASLKLQKRSEEWIKDKSRRLLFRDAELREVQNWAKKHPEEVDGAGLAFIKASLDAQKSRGLMWSIGVLSVFALIGTSIAFGITRQPVVNAANTQAAIQQATARAANTQAAGQQPTVQAANTQAAEKSQVAASGELAAQALSNLEAFPQRSLLLAVEALRGAAQANGQRVPAAEDALRQVLANTGGHVLGNQGDTVQTAAQISVNSRWLIIGGQLWDLTAADPTSTRTDLLGQGVGVFANAISPDVHWLVTAHWDMYTGTPVLLWDLTSAKITSKSLAILGGGDDIDSLTISPDGRWLVMSSTKRDDSTKKTILWNLTASDPPTTEIILTGVGSPLTISSDSHWLVTESEKAEAVHLWDLVTPNLSNPTVLKDIEEQSSTTSVAFSANNRWLAVGTVGATLLWDLTDSSLGDKPLILRESNDDLILKTVFSPDNHWLVTEANEDNAPRLWDLTKPDPSEQVIVLRGHRFCCNTISISQDSHWLFSADSLDEDTPGILWDLTTDNPSVSSIVLRGQKGINSAIISPNNRWLITGSSDKTVHLWDLTTPAPSSNSVILRGHDESITDLVISPDNRWLVTLSWDRMPRLWDLTAPSQSSAPIGLQQGPLEADAISLDNHWLAARASGQAIHLWDLTDLSTGPVSFVGHQEMINDVKISADDQWLVTASGVHLGFDYQDETVRLWRLADPYAQPIVLPGHQVIGSSEVEISFGNQWLAARATRSNEILLWRVDNLFAGPTRLKHDGPTSDIAFSPDNHWLASVGWGDTKVFLWDLTSSDPSADPLTLQGHEEEIWRVRVSPDGRWLVTGSDDKTARIWDLKDLKSPPIVLQNEGPATEIAISPDSQWLVTYGGIAYLSNLKDLATAPITLRDSGGPMIFSPDSQWLATAGKYNQASGDDPAVRLWDLANFNATPIVLPNSVTPVAFTPDNSWLITGSKNGISLMWSLHIDELIDLACKVAGRNLTNVEWKQYFQNQGHRKTCEQWPVGNE